MQGRALVAWNVRRIRTDRGLSQERLAQEAGLDRTYISDIERELGNVTVDLLDRVAAALSCKVGELFLEPAEGAERPGGLRPGRKGPRHGI